MNVWKKYRGVIRLAGMVMAVPLVAWFAGFRDTVGLWCDYHAHQERIVQLRTDEEGGTVVTTGQGAADEQVLDNGVLLDRLAGVLKDNRVAFVKYMPYLTREEGVMQVYTGELVLTGGFIPLLKVMARAEQPDNPGKIVSAGFRLHYDRNHKEYRLIMTLVMQQLTMEESK